MVEEHLANAAEAVARAPFGALDGITQAAYAAWGRGEIGDAEANAITAAVETRRQDLKPKAAAAAPIGCKAASVVLTGAIGRRSHVGARPISSESLARRRRVCASGWMPPSLAASFTAGETAALSIIACEVASRGLCRFTLARISAAAGVSRSTAKRAIRQAQALGLLVSKEWRLERFRNAPNTVEITSPEWITWLRMRSRSAEARKGGGVQEGTGFKLHNYKSTENAVDAPSTRGTFGRKEGRAEPFLTAEMLRQGARQRRGRAEPYTPKRNHHLAALDAYLGSQNA